MLESDTVVSTSKTEETREPARNWRALGAGAAAALVAGYAVVAAGLVPVPEASTPLARIGYALREQSVTADPDAWAALRADAERARAAWKGPEPAALELVLAVRGLANGGNPEWKRAEELCHTLKWPRCDQAALEELARRSRP
jgi:hypothetical protein